MNQAATLAPIRTIRTDITTLEVDVIINDENESPLLNGGICEAILHAAGPV